MRILCLNCGSATLKFDVLDSDHGRGDFLRVASGQIDRIGDGPEATLTVGSEEVQRSVEAPSHDAAFDAALNLLSEAGLLEGIEAVGHRVVHGGTRFDSATRLDDGVIAAIREVSALAPLHNTRALSVIEEARSRLGPGVPMVAAFDTAFFAALPEAATTYALPRRIREEYGVRRFGFHGLAHHYMVEQYACRKPHAKGHRVITLQLGSGCSAAASVGGKPIDTSMGFTPLEGLIMGTRSGSIDPSIPLFLTRSGLSADAVESLLNTESGLLGLSGRSADLRDLIEAEAAGDKDAALAVEAFCLSVKKYVGAYMALLGGADAIVFGGGIGQHSPRVRARVCEGMEWAGIRLKSRWNKRATHGEMIISEDDSAVEVWVMSVDEAEVIAGEVLAVLQEEQTGGG